jgi:hypothetical protein
MTDNESGLQTEQDKEMCAIALDEAFGLCGNNDVIFQQIAMMMGIRSESLEAVTPLKDKYRGVLAVGPGMTDRSAAQWVIARAWDLTVNENVGIMDAFNRAWEEADEKQGKSGAPVDTPAPAGNDQPDIDEFPEDEQ